MKAANRQRQMTTFVAGMIRWVNTYNKPYPRDFSVPDGSSARVTIVHPGSGSHRRRARTTAADHSRDQRNSGDELPDYRPPFGTTSVRADADGNLWIRTILAKPIPGGAVFDIVNRAGELVDRIQLPAGYAVVGFGRGGIVYLSMRDDSGIHLTRVRLAH